MQKYRKKNFERCRLRFAMQSTFFKKCNSRILMREGEFENIDEKLGSIRDPIKK